MQARVRIDRVMSVPVSNDARLTDAEFRTYSWLASYPNGVVVSVSEQCKTRCLSLGDIVKQMQRLESFGFLKLVEGGNETLVFIGVQERSTMMEDLQQKSQAALEQQSARRAAKQVERTRAPKEVLFTAQSFRKVFQDTFRKTWPEVPVPAWTLKQLAIAKRFIQLLGIDDAQRAIALTFENWPKIVDRYKVRGYPSVEWMMGFRQTALLELLSGKPIGGSKSAAGVARQISLKGSEHDEQRSAETPDVGW
jgi:hypothetical protein